jgi:hypothetical protein
MTMWIARDKDCPGMLGVRGATVSRLPLAAARCSGVALCKSSAFASWPAFRSICDALEGDSASVKAIVTRHLHDVCAAAVSCCMQRRPLLPFANCNLRFCGYKPRGAKSHNQRECTCSCRGVACNHAATAGASPAEMMSKTVGTWPLLIIRVAASQNTVRALVNQSTEAGKRQGGWGERGEFDLRRRQ